MATALVNDLRLHYEDDGPEHDTGTAPILLLHGFARNGNFWRDWVPALAREHRIIRPDIRGCGASEDPGEGYVFDLDDVVSDYIGLLDALDIECVHHIGESTGGIVGAMTAARHPERFKSLTLVSTPITPLTSDPGVKSPGAATPEESLAALGLKQWWLQSRALTGELFGDDRDVEIAEDFARTPLHVALSMWRSMHKPEVTLEPYLGMLTMPTFVLTPTASFTMTPEQQTALVAAVPDVRQRVYEGAPHGMYFLNGGALADDVLEFIDAV
jgi:3-oxoadipate enol-lactonase